MSEEFIPTFGWVNDQTQVWKIDGEIENQGQKAMFADAAPNLMVDDDDAPVFMWDAEMKVLGALQPSFNQGSIGSCVGNGYARGAQDLLILQVASGSTEQWPGAGVAVEPIYGGSRVEVGGGRIGGDGSVGAWAAKWLKDWGVLLRKKYSIGGTNYDFTTYSIQRCRQYGDSGVPAPLEQVAKEHPVTAVAMVRSADEAWAAIGGGKPVPICSDQGFTTNLVGGFCEPSGTWNHCVKPDAIIAGKTFKKAKDVRIGDEVYGRDGVLHTVTEVHRRNFSGNTVHIKPQAGKPLVVTDEHPVLVYRRVRQKVANLVLSASVANEQNMPNDLKYREMNYSPIWVKAMDVRPGDYLATPAALDSELESPNWPVSDKAIKKPKDLVLDPEMAFMFGFYVGDGNVKKDHGIGFTLSLTDPVDRIVLAIRKIGLEPRVEVSDTYQRVIVDSVILAEAFSEWFGTSSYEKRLPDWLVRGEFARHAIEGVLASDGCQYKGKNIVQSCSQILIEQMRMMLINQGFAPVVDRVVRGKGAYANAAPSWTISWSSSKKRYSRKVDHLQLYEVKSVLLLPYSGEVFNFDVEETHDYVADGYVVHNCMLLRGRFVHPQRGKCFVIQNSWGAYLNGDNVIPHVEGRGSVALPEGCFATTFAVVDRIVKQQDSFALAGLKGWERERIDYTP